MGKSERNVSKNTRGILRKYSLRKIPMSKEAIGRTKSLINKLKKQGGTVMRDFETQIKKRIQLGTLERMSPERAREVLARPHHCTYPGVVTSETSTSTATRKINDTNTNIPGSANTCD